MDVLRYVDVFIGLALVMLLGCSVVAAFVQWITSMLRTRADFLKQGLSDIVQALDPDIPDSMCREVCELLVRHPLVSRPESWWDLISAKLRQKPTHWIPSGQPTDALLRHEFLRIVLEWASGEGVYGRRADLATYTERLRAALQANGVPSPSQALANVRLQTLLQERSNPAAPAHEWHTAAMIDACPSALVGKVTGWYDSMSNRTSQRFKTHTQVITAAAALALAIALPLDSVALLQRLSTDDQLRKELVAEAQQVVNQEIAGNKADSDTAVKAKQQLEMLRSPRLAIVDPSADRLKAAPGIILSWVLLGLGAPFWYDMLKNALRFRSLIAQKDDQERKDRQQAEQTPGRTAATPAVAPAAGAAGAVVTVAAVAAVPDDESGDPADLVAVG